MKSASLVSAFLQGHRGKSVCARCIADTIRRPANSVQRAMTRLEGMPEYRRRHGFAEIRWRYRPDEAAALEHDLHSWRGLGDVIVGMSAQRFDVELRQLGGQYAVRRAAWQAISDPRIAA